MVTHIPVARVLRTLFTLVGTGLVVSAAVVGGGYADYAVAAGLVAFVVGTALRFVPPRVRMIGPETLEQSRRRRKRVRLAGYGAGVFVGGVGLFLVGADADAWLRPYVFTIGILMMIAGGALLGLATPSRTTG